MRSCAKSGSPVALLSQGSVTALEREDMISPIFRFQPAFVQLFLLAPTPSPPRTIFFHVFTRFFSEHLLLPSAFQVFKSLPPHTLDSQPLLILSVMDDF